MRRLRPGLEEVQEMEDIEEETEEVAQVAQVEEFSAQKREMLFAIFCESAGCVK